MENDGAPEQATEIMVWLWAEATRWVELLITPGWRQYQVGIVLALALLAYLLRGPMARRLDAWGRAREGWPKWRLRMLVQIRQRLGLLLFAVSAWAVYGIMQQITWPSRSYFVGVAARWRRSGWR